MEEFSKCLKGSDEAEMGGRLQSREQRQESGGLSGERGRQPGAAHPEEGEDTLPTGQAAGSRGRSWQEEGRSRALLREVTVHAAQCRGSFRKG